MEKLGINLGYLIVQILNFVVIFVVLRAWVYKPLMAMLEKRRATIAQGLEDARIAEEARANAEKEKERILSEAQTKAAEIVREAAERAEKPAQQQRLDPGPALGLESVWPAGASRLDAARNRPRHPRPRISLVRDCRKNGIHCQ